MTNLPEIIGEYESFLAEIIGRVAAAGFDLHDFVQLDHMCYRAVSTENYQAKQRELSQVARLLREIMVNGRPISVFRLPVPIRYDRWRIDAIELASPKAGRTFTEGLEHIEFVLFDEPADFLAKHPDKLFDLKSAERGINPEIGFKLGEYQVKFHRLNLPTVVFLEEKLGIDEVAN